MLESIKDKVISKGMALLSSPAVAKILESEKAGKLMELAIGAPAKLSGVLEAQKERVVALFNLATQEDVDDLRRAMARMEGALRDIKKDSSDLLRKVDEDQPGKSTIAQ
ncbi:MAG: hypothetical protein PHU25_01890 [Deltaproteobacteria bacterium]|nr:hypothetical protein [Deltaproteobacteria bacterium]